MAILNPSSLEYQACLEEYEERLKIIDQDLKWLLALNYQKFWCQVLFDQSCQNLLDSYLKLAPRPYDVYKIQLPNQIIALLNSIHKSVFLVCLRMSTYKESKVFKEIIKYSVSKNLKILLLRKILLIKMYSPS